MSGFLLDTNVPSELVRSLPEPKVTAWFASQDLESLYFSVVSFGELRKGLTIMPSGQRRTQLETWLETDLFRLFAGRVLPITQSIAERWGTLEGQRQLRGRPLGVPDAQIAATVCPIVETAPPARSRSKSTPTHCRPCRDIHRGWRHPGSCQ